jgi:predicted RNA-binding Zn ribbon-like protein
MNVRTDPFEWSGGHPALDFVNTLDERPSLLPIENLASYTSLVGFTKLAGLVEPPIATRLLASRDRACARIATRARTLREHLHDVLKALNEDRAASKADLLAISTAIRAAHAARHLIPSASSGLAAFTWTSPGAADIPLHACALAIERLLVDVDRRRIRKCGASDCDVYYLDTSKGQIRHWCSMKNCGNREKQRRWRER